MILIQRAYLITFIIVFLLSCGDRPSSHTKISTNNARVELSIEEAQRLSALPLKCMQQEFPNKLGQTLNTAEDMGTPMELHPAFYGCFDWHSSVHGHWMLVRLLKTYPNLKNQDMIKQKLLENISKENILHEVAYFDRVTEKSYERTYGWAWLLKLAEEIYTWDDSISPTLTKNMEPLTELIVNRYLDFLPRLKYPIRVGEHTNTAFGISFAWDYANTFGNDTLKSLIESRARDFYLNDINCPMTWEPSGYDFLSPCLEEMDLMRRVLSAEEFANWMNLFLPQLKSRRFSLAPAQVSDRTDGKLVHLDGLNFSRAWCLFGLSKQYSEYEHLEAIATEHINFSLKNIVDGAYEGEHWLASFAVYALSEANK